MLFYSWFGKSFETPHSCLVSVRDNDVTGLRTMCGAGHVSMRNQSL